LPGTVALIPRVVLASSCRGPVALTPAVAGDCRTHPAGRTGQLLPRACCAHPGRCRGLLHSSRGSY